MVRKFFFRVRKKNVFIKENTHTLAQNKVSPYLKFLDVTIPFIPTSLLILSFRPSSSLTSISNKNYTHMKHVQTIACYVQSMKNEKWQKRAKLQQNDLSSQWQPAKNSW